MRRVTYIVALGTLAAAVAGCTDPYAPRTGYSQSYYNSQASYGYPSGYSSYPAYPAYQSGSGTYPSRYGYGSGGDYNRNYSSAPQVVFTLP